MGDRKGTRHKNIRQMKQAVESLERAEKYIIGVGCQYPEADPHLYEAFCALVTAVDAVTASTKACITVM